MLKKKIDFNKYKVALGGENSIKALNAMGNDISQEIRTRTKRGIDVNYNQFRAYKPSTIIKKGSSIVDLEDTYEMLKSIRFKRITNGINFHFVGSRKQGKKTISNTEIAYHNQVTLKREFFGIDKKQLKQIEKDIISNIKRKI